MRRLEADVSSLNPLLATSRYDRQVANYLFTPLIYLDRDLHPVEGLAQSWEVLEGGRLYRFRLNERATFSDGQPVRASDVLFTLQKVVDPRSESVQAAGYFTDLDLSKTRAVDPLTVEIAFRKVLGSQMGRFNELLVLPEHVYGKGDFRRDFNDTAVGSGPYRLARREPGREIVVEKRRDYWARVPFLDSVVFKVIDDHATAWNAVRRGDIDETFVRSDTWLREQANPALSPVLAFQRFYTLNYNAIAWNNRDRVLADQRVRRALAACVPIESIVQDLYQGTARAMSGPFTPDQFAYNPRVPVIRKDLDEARRLLAAAGWRDEDGDGDLEREGKPFRIELVIMAGSSTGSQFAQLLQAEVKQVGGEIVIATLDTAHAIERLMAGNFQAAYLSWDLDPDPDPFAIFHSSQTPPRGQNFVRYANPAADRLIEQARTEIDERRRQTLYWQLHELLASDQPYTWTVQSSARWAISKRIQGIEVSPGYGLFLWYPGEFGWWIPQEMHGGQRGPR